MKIIVLLFVSSITFFIHANGIIVRFAQRADLSSICHLDRIVTYEYFKPFYQYYYAHFELGKNPDPFLEKELAADEKDFKEYLTISPNRIIIALDDNQIVGLLVWHREELLLILDLLLIDQQYRQQGIGKKLVKAMLDINQDASICIVYPIIDNIAAIQFYEKLGFINQGKSQKNGKNIYGISYGHMYWQYELKINIKGKL